jgi:molecular chaperone DnaK (HSP70)
MAVGIDLGTTYSAVAWVDQDGDPEIIPNLSGEPLTASVVTLNAEGRPVVGADAKADQAEGKAEVAHLFKRFMGNSAFRLVLGGRDWSPPELSACVLAHLKAQAEGVLGRPVTRAVVTVPEYFTHPERAATLEAGRLAGLDILRLMSEPTAAALAYGLRPGPDTRRVLVYDLGGGTFDISLVEIGPQEISVIGAEGDHELGGRDWDDRLIGEILRGLPDSDAAALVEHTDVLLVEAERLKQTLSARRTADMRVTVDGRTFRTQVTREAFETASQDLLEQTGLLTTKLLLETGLDWADIQGVLPVGGSTRMPMVKRWIEQMSGRPPMGGIHPDHAVALGAAAQAAILLEEQAEEAAGSRLRLPGADRNTAGPILRLGAPRTIKNVVVHSLGMIAESTEGDRYVNSVLLPRNQRIPSAATRPYHFRLKGDGREVMEIFLTQGETDDVQDCTYLGRYVVTGFPTGRKRQAVIDVTYTYDDSALVQVAAADRATGAALDVTVEEVPADVPGRFLKPPRRDGTRQPMTVYLAFDLSGSMSGDPLTEAKRAARTFVGQLDLTTTSVGLIGFSDRVDVALRATNNAAKIECAITSMSIGTTGFGNETHPFDHIRELLTDDHRRFGVVLADGVWSRQDLATRRARRCHQAGIEIFAVGFGGADHAFLRKVASSTEQALFTRLGSLSEVFGTIAREITEAGTTP